MIPPIVTDYVILYREPESPAVVVVLSNQDSFEVSAQEAETYLRLLGVPEDCKVLAYTWNFQGAKLDLSDMRMEPLSLEQAMSFVGSQKEPAF
jgi:hypothetical protein